MRTLTADGLKELLAEETGHVFAMLLEFSHASIVTPYRYCNNTSDITYSSNVYSAYPFTPRLVNDEEDQVTQVLISLDNVAQSMINDLRSIADPIDVTMNIVRVDPRENLLLYSEQFDNAAWTKYSLSVSANATEAPDGSFTADKLIPAIASPPCRTLQAVTIALNDTVILSVYVKAAEYSTAQLIVHDGTALRECIYDVDMIAGTITLNTELVFSNVASIIENIGNGWYRVSCTVLTAVVTTIYAQFEPHNGAIGDGTSGIYAWGAQLNIGILLPYAQTTTTTLTRNNPVLEVGPLSYKLNSITYNVSTIEMYIGYEFDVLNAPGNPKTFNPAIAPALFK